MKIFKNLDKATIERQVEDIYNEAISKAFGAKHFEYPFACDGYCEFKIRENTHRLLIEYKFDEDLSGATGRSKILAQVLFYLKKFEVAGKPLPNVVFMADRNECFVIHTNSIFKYLDFDGVDWDKAPSHAYTNIDLVLALSEDKDITPFVFDITEDFDFDNVVEKIKSMASGTVRRIRITEHNVDEVFNVFMLKVLTEKNYPTNDAVALFFNVVTGCEDTYLHPTRKNALVSNGKNIRVNGKNFEAFCLHFSTNCSPREKARLASISDRLIEDTNRRKKGEFYTPTVWVDESHRRIASAWGDDWKEKFVVWDPACGSMNLTRDYTFSNLYASTLENGELEIAKNCNIGASKFQFDFLNDELKRVSEGGKVPDSLIDALEAGGPIIFFMNPPYATANNMGATGTSKGSICKTAVNTRMLTDKIGNAAQNLYAQFLYRIMEIKKQYQIADVRLAFFCNPNYMTGGAFEKFRKVFLTTFKFESGMLFNAGHFADTASRWGINFSLWSSSETTDKNAFIHDLVDLDDCIKIIGTKALYNLDDKQNINEWVREPIKGLKTFDEPNMMSAIKVRDSNSITYGKNIQNHFGYYVSAGINVCCNSQNVGIFSSAFGIGHGCGINKDNFDRCCTAFAARRLIECSWINNQDMYAIPNESHPEYKQFVDDALIYSLFESKSQQSSLRNIEYKGKTWNIVNQFTFCSMKDIAEWSDEVGLDETYNEASSMKDSYMMERLKTANLSDEAKAVLEMARDLVKKSMKLRQMFDDEHPEYQIKRADASRYQIKGMLKEYMPEELKTFRETFKKLADKMRLAVYTLGFLR